MKFHGGCLCGQVRFAIEGEPVFAGFCHCRDCQKSGGGGHNVSAGFAVEAVAFSGNVHEYDYVGTSGGAVARAFCPVCGSRLYSRADSAGPILMIAAGALDDPNILTPDFHIVTSGKPVWDYVDPTRIASETYPSEDD